MSFSSRKRFVEAESRLFLEENAGIFNVPSFFWEAKDLSGAREKLRKLREQDTLRIKERLARQQRMKDHQTEVCA